MHATRRTYALTYYRGIVEIGGNTRFFWQMLLTQYEVLNCEVDWKSHKFQYFHKNGVTDLN